MRSGLMAHVDELGGLVASCCQRARSVHSVVRGLAHVHPALQQLSQGGQLQPAQGQGLRQLLV